MWTKDLINLIPICCHHWDCGLGKVQVRQAWYPGWGTGTRPFWMSKIVNFWSDETERHYHTLYIYIYIYIFREYEEILFLADLWRLSGEKWSSIWLMDRCPFLVGAYLFISWHCSRRWCIIGAKVTSKTIQKLAPKWRSGDCY